jgi:GDP-4-dehydro-6-deoxy-D-mannose reductase
VRILVTGSGGFVGQHLCRYLASVGDEVVPCPGPDGPGALDVTDAEAMLLRIREARPDGIIHLAGMSSVAWSHAHPTKTFFVNVLGAVNLLQAVRETIPASRLLLIGSGEMYGRIPEGYRAREEDPVHSLSPYGASKCAAEEAARQYAASYGIQVACARPFNHLGAGQAPHFVVPSFARQITDVKRGKRAPLIEVGDLSPVRDFLHVEDVVRGYRLLLERGEPGKTYNVCSGEPVSIRAILDQLVAIAAVQLELRVDPARLRPTEIPWLVGDPSRLRALGWHPRRTVHEALEEAFNEALGG